MSTHTIPKYKNKSPQKCYKLHLCPDNYTQQRYVTCMKGTPACATFTQTLALNCVLENTDSQTEIYFSIRPDILQVQHWLCSPMMFKRPKTLIKLVLNGFKLHQYESS